jgi:hypothetical protein
MRRFGLVSAGLNTELRDVGAQNRLLSVIIPRTEAAAAQEDLSVLLEKQAHAEAEAAAAGAYDEPAESHLGLYLGLGAGALALLGLLSLLLKKPSKVSGYRRSRRRRSRR